MALPPFVGRAVFFLTMVLTAHQPGLAHFDTTGEGMSGTLGFGCFAESISICGELSVRQSAHQNGAIAIKDDRRSNAEVISDVMQCPSLSPLHEDT